MKLYVAGRSGNCHKVSLMLSVLGLAHEKVEMSYSDGSLKTPEYLAKNPRGQVPVLEDDGTAIWDSGAILVYLARRYGGEDWLPLDPVGMAEVVQWLTLSAIEHLFGLARCRILKRTDQAEGYDQAHALATKALDIMEKRLANHDWLALDRPTIAEMACYSYVGLADEGGIEVGAWPAVAAWTARVRALPGFVEVPRS